MLQLEVSWEKKSMFTFETNNGLLLKKKYALVGLGHTLLVCQGLHWNLTWWTCTCT